MSRTAAEAVRSFVRDRLGERGLAVLVLVGGDLLDTESLGDLGPKIVAAPEGSYEPYGGLLDAAFPSLSHEGLKATLPKEVLDEPRSSLHGVLAHAIVARRTAPEASAELWVVRPADGMSAAGIRLLEELAESGASMAPLRVVLAVSEDDEVTASLTRRIPAGALQIVKLGAATEKAPGRRDHRELSRAALDTGDAAVAAYHLMRAGEPHEAVTSLCEAATQARALGDLEVASEALRHAYLCLGAEQWYRRIEILEQSAEVLTEQRLFGEAITAFEEIAGLAQVYGGQESPARLCRIAQSYRSLGKWEEAERALDRASALAADGAEAEDIAVERAELHLAAGDASAARSFVEAVLPELVEGSIARLQLLDVCARAEALSGLSEKAMAHARELLEGATALGHAGLVARAHMSLAYAFFNRAEADRAREHYTQALEGFEAYGDRTMVTRCLLNLGSLCFERGEHETALASFSRAQRLMQREGDLRGLAFALNNTAAVHAARGEMVRAKQLVHEALGLVHDLKEVVWEGTLSANAAGIAASLGRREEAWAYLLRAQEICAMSDVPILKAATALASADVAILGGAFERAILSIEEARESIAAAGSRSLSERTVRTLAQAHALSGDQASALRCAEQSYELALGMPADPSLGSAQVALSTLLCDEEPAKAESLAREALGSGGESANPAFLAEALHALGRAVEAQGRTAEACGLVVRALDELERFAAQIDPPDRERLYAHPVWASLLGSAAALGRKPQLT